MKKTSYIFIGLTIMLSLAFFGSCGQKKAKDGRTDTPTSGTIQFVADESLSPIIEEERSQFEFEYPKAHLKPLYSDEVTGLQMIKDFKTTLLFTTRALKDSEIAYLKSKSNVIPSVFPIGYDGLAFIVNKNNNDTCITVNDIKRILTGKANKWSDVVPGSKRGDIEVVFDNTRSATTNYVVDSVLHGEKFGAKIMAAQTRSRSSILLIKTQMLSVLLDLTG